MDSIALRKLAYAGLMTWLGVDMLVVFTKSSRNAQRADRGSLAWLVLILWAGISLSVYCGVRDIGRFNSELMLPLQILGMAIMAGGIAVRTLAIHQLGRLHMPVVAIQADHPLMDRGLYARLRHPSYFGATLAFFGFGLALGSWVAVLAALGGALISYGYRIHVEEQALVRGLGPRYIDYQQRTKRFIPWVY